MEKVYISELIDDFLNRNLPITDNVYDLLAEKPKAAGRSLMNIVRESLYEFEKSYIFIRAGYITVPTSGIYTFVDNYDDYIDGKIAEENIELVPKVIHTVGSFNYAYSSSYWEYNAPTLQCYRGKVFVRGFYSYRLWFKYDEEGIPTNDSHIYGLEPSKHLPYYRNIFDLYMLRSIRARMNLIDLGSGISVLRLDDRISELRDLVEENASTSSDVFDAWR